MVHTKNHKFKNIHADRCQNHQQTTLENILQTFIKILKNKLNLKHMNLELEF